MAYASSSEKECTIINKKTCALRQWSTTFPDLQLTFSPQVAAKAY